MREQRVGIAQVLGRAQQGHVDGVGLAFDDLAGHQHEGEQQQQDREAAGERQRETAQRVHAPRRALERTERKDRE